MSINCRNGFRGNCESGSIPVVESLVLDGEKGELVNSSGRVGKTNRGSEPKTLAALKSHSEAERRRRERINANLATLRGLVPSHEKMDKSTLLAEAINQVKHLKKTATQASEGLHLPMDTDEVKVEKLEGNTGDVSFLLRASLCCEYRPGLLSDFRQAIKNLPIHIMKSEISILGGRIKIVFLLTTIEEGNNNGAEASVHSTLSNILDKLSASAEYAQQIFFPQKRKKVSYLETSCSSS